MNASNVRTQSLFARVFRDTHLCPAENEAPPVWAAVQRMVRYALCSPTAPDNCHHPKPEPSHLEPRASFDRVKRLSRGQSDSPTPALQATPLSPLQPSPLSTHRS